MTAGQAVFDAMFGKSDCDWSTASKPVREQCERAATAARAWKEPTLGQFMWQELEKARQVTNYKSALEVAAQAVAAVERAEIREIVVRLYRANAHPDILANEILEAIDARGK